LLTCRGRDAEGNLVRGRVGEYNHCTGCRGGSRNCRLAFFTIAPHSVRLAVIAAYHHRGRHREVGTSAIFASINSETDSHIQATHAQEILPGRGDAVAAFRDVSLVIRAIGCGARGGVINGPLVQAQARITGQGLAKVEQLIEADTTIGIPELRRSDHEIGGLNIRRTVTGKNCTWVDLRDHLVSGATNDIKRHTRIVGAEVCPVSRILYAEIVKVERVGRAKLDVVVADDLVGAATETGGERLVTGVDRDLAEGLGKGGHNGE